MYDHAQSPRFGQKTAVENPGVLYVTSTGLPEIAYHGQLVYLYDMDEFRVFDAIQAKWRAPTAQASAGVSTKVGATAPVPDAVGDIWLSTVDGKYRKWDGTDWVEITDPQSIVQDYNASWALYQAQKAMDLTQGEQTTYYSTTPPTDPPPVENDLWLRTTDNVLFKYTGSPLDWVQQDSLLAKAINDAGTAKATVDGKISTYRTLWADRPLDLGPEDEGDLLYVIDKDNKVYRWPGASEWEELPLGQQAIADEAITGSKLSGDAIDGKVITGALIRTAASGLRVEIPSNGYLVQFLNDYTGIAGGHIQGYANSSGSGNIELYPPYKTSSHTTKAPPRMSIVSTANGLGEYFQFEADHLTITNQDPSATSGGDLFVGGDSVLQGTLQVGAITADSVALPQSRRLSRINGGSGTWTTGPAGRITIPHGLGTTPHFAIFMNSNFHSVKATLYSVDAANIAFQMHNSDSGTDLGGGTDMTGHWLALRF